MFLLLCATALAGMVTAPPPGATEVGLLLCAGEACNDRMFWLTHDSNLGELPVVSVEALLVDEVASTQDSEAAESWRQALEEARLALIEDRRFEAEAALDRAGAALSMWAGDPPTQELFAWYVLRGFVAERKGEHGRSGEALRQAAAVAWNRSVVLPEGTEAWAEHYARELQAVISQGTGELFVEDGGNSLAFSLNGVLLGKAPLRVQVFPGEHRLSAGNARQAHAWSEAVRVTAGRTSTVRALLANDDDAQWVTYQLALAVDTMSLDEDVARLVERWAERHGIRSLRLLRLDAQLRGPMDEIDREVGAAMPTFTLREARYEPSLRRLSPGG
jgi:hypothetical protein